MISKEKIVEIIAEQINADNNYIVEVKVSPTNKISVTIDSMEGLSIDYCIKISRMIDASFDREVEDFELEVSTPGLGQAFKVVNQYKKNIGKDVEVIPLETVPFKAKLTEVFDDGFAVEEERKVKIEGKNKKEIKVFNHNYKFDQVKSVRLIITF